MNIWSAQVSKNINAISAVVMLQQSKAPSSLLKIEYFLYRESYSFGFFKL
jgi:hypothetical protein